MIWINETHWVKFCFEFSPAKKPMVVSVVTSGLSDDSNAFTVDGEEIWYRIARQGHVYALHSSFDGITWELIRVFSLGLDTAHHLLGFEAQSPTGDGCSISFDQIQFKSERLVDFRDGS
jgi:regulation of enolase protein 1 (concanavalin A-like superfamily)